MSERQPAETFPVADFIWEEVEARKWSLTDLLTRSGLSNEELVGIMNGTMKVTARRSEQLSRAFGTSPQLWAALDMAHRRRGEGRPA